MACVRHRGSVASGVWLVVTLVVPLLLLLFSTVDLDGDPLTPNVPDAVLVAPAAVPDAVEARAERVVDAPPIERRWARRAVHFARRAERWTVLLRRFHRSVLTDIPI